MKGIIFVGFYIFSCTIVVCQVIPGLSPSKPNRLLKTCISQSGSMNSTLEFNNQPANSINVWCRSYKNALPCTTKYLPNAVQSNPNDWYLSLVYDEEYARKTSRSLCSRLKKYGNKMGCLTTEMNQAETCVRMLTSPIADYIHRSYQQNQTIETEPNENSLRACLIPVTASRCFKPFFKKCRKGIRKLLARYFMILSGKCLKIVKEHQKSTTPTPSVQQESIQTSAKSSVDEVEEDQFITEEGNVDHEEDQPEGQFDEKSSQDDVGIKQNVVINPQSQHFEQTTKRMQFANMHIIQRVIESDSQIEPDMASTRISQGAFIQTQRLSNIHDRFIGGADHLEFFKQTTTFPPKTIAEDIYIPDSQILSAMKTLPEKDIVKPNEEKEAKLIVSVYENETDSESGSRDSENASTTSESESTTSENESTDSEYTGNDSGSAGNDSESAGNDSEIAGHDSGSGGKDSGSAGNDSESTGNDSENTDKDSKTTGNDSESTSNDSESTGNEGESEGNESESAGNESESEGNDSESTGNESESESESESSEEDTSEEIPKKTTSVTTTEKVIVSTRKKMKPIKTTKSSEIRKSKRQPWRGDSNGLTVVYNKVTIVILTLLSLTIKNF